MLWLIGMMGSGKSTVGRLVAERRGVPFQDTDRLVEAMAGKGIPEIWAEEGEAGFRRRESRAITAAAAAGDGVVATGGGVVTVPANVVVMRDTGLVVWLRAAPAMLADRVGGLSDRPLLAGRDPVEELARLIAERERLYADAAHRVVVTDGRDAFEVAEEVGALWED